MNAPANRGPIKPPTRGPVLLAFEICMGLVMVALFSWFVGIVIEVIGMHTMWKDEGEAHDEPPDLQFASHHASAERPGAGPWTGAVGTRRTSRTKGPKVEARSGGVNQLSGRSRRHCSNARNANPKRRNDSSIP